MFCLFTTHVLCVKEGKFPALLCLPPSYNPVAHLCITSKMCVASTTAKSTITATTMTTLCPACNAFLAGPRKAFGNVKGRRSQHVANFHGTSPGVSLNALRDRCIPLKRHSSQLPSVTAPAKVAKDHGKWYARKHLEQAAAQVRSFPALRRGQGQGDAPWGAGE